MDKTGIVIQARMGSTRLKGKMNRLFHENETILSVLVNQLLTHFSPSDVVLAIPETKDNDVLSDLAGTYGIKVVRGHETNVLSRFLQAADRFNFDAVVRICADNPFLRSELIIPLIENLVANELDYCSYQSPEGVPVIRCHYGLFAEVIRVDALKRVAEEAKEEEYFEHVTNYIYTHPELFEVGLCHLPIDFKPYDFLRLTIDTEEDFKLAQDIYTKLNYSDSDVSLKELLSFIEDNKDYKFQMKESIIANTK